MNRDRRSGNREGFVLIAALWLIVALAAVGLDASLRSKTRRLAAANMLDETRARAAALAGEAYAQSRLTAALLDGAQTLRLQAARNARGGPNRGRGANNNSIRNLFRNNPLEDPWRDPQELVPEEVVLDNGTRFVLRVRDVGAALNINSADADMLRRFFADGLGVDYAAADRLAQAILDWRDEDTIPRLNGAEVDEYLRAGAAVLPPNRGEFDDISELRHVLGMTPEIYEAARPYLTLLGTGQINVNSAPEPVLVALPGMTPAAAAEIVRMRESGLMPRNAQELLQLLPRGVAAAIDAAGPAFSRRATFTTDSVELISEGRMDGSQIRVRATALLTRSMNGAIVTTRRVTP